MIRLRHILFVAMGALAVTAAPSVSAAQSTPDAGLASPDLTDRENAVAQLSAMPVGDIAPATRATLIALLESEGQVLQAPRGPDLADDDEHEEYAAYLTNLVMLVVQFDDPSAVRGLCLTGLGVNRSVQRFIAAHARQSLPYLDEAWKDEAQRQGVLETWSAILASTTSGLSISERQGVLNHVLAAQSTNPLGFVWAAKLGNIVDFASLVDSVGAHAANDVVSARANIVGTSLHATAAATSTSELLQRTNGWLGVVCAGASGARNGACTSAANLLSDASAQIDRASPAAANVLNAYIQRIANASRSGVFTSAEAALLTENAVTIARRL